MDRNTLIYLLSQLCEMNFIKQLSEKRSEENWDEMGKLIQDKMQCNQQESTFQSQNSIIIIRNFQNMLIQKNNGSVRQALSQLEELEESIMLIIENTNSLHNNLKLIETSLSQVIQNMKKLALLEMKQIITILISQVSGNTIGSQLNDLLQHIKLNTRYFLGYESLDPNIIELESFSQIKYVGYSTPSVSKEVIIEKEIYHRSASANKRCNNIIEKKISKKNLEVLKEYFQEWKKEFMESPIESESIETICNLWYMIIDEVEEILREKSYDAQQIEGQLNLWTFQKQKSLL